MLASGLEAAEPCLYLGCSSIPWYVGAEQVEGVVSTNSLDPEGTRSSTKCCEGPVFFFF